LFLIEKMAVGAGRVLLFSFLSSSPSKSRATLNTSMAEDADADAIFLDEDDAGEVVADLDDGGDGARCDGFLASSQCGPTRCSLHKVPPPRGALPCWTHISHAHV